VSRRAGVRLFVLRVVVVAILATLFGRLWFLQVVGGEEYAQAASANRVREVVQPAPRGEVFDARGTPLVRNRTALVVSVNRSDVGPQPTAGRPSSSGSARCSGVRPTCCARRSGRAAAASNRPAGAALRTSRCPSRSSTRATAQA
jgi:penicillin-binding protein 2